MNSVAHQHVELTGRQQAALNVIVEYWRATGEPCPGSFVARRLNVHHSRAQEFISILHRKGWLRAPNAPSMPTIW